VAQFDKGRNCAETSRLPSVWVLCDLKPLERGTRVVALQQMGFNVERVSDANAVNARWLEELFRRKPTLLWIALHASCTRQGNRADRRIQRKEIHAARSQNTENRLCVVEAQSRESSWQFIPMDELQADTRWNKTTIPLCSLGISGKNGKPTIRKVHTLTNFTAPIALQCKCGANSSHTIDIGDHEEHRQLVIKHVLESMPEAVPGFACEPRDAGQFDTQCETADEVTGKAKSSRRRKVRFQSDDLTDQPDNPEARVTALCASYPTDQRKREKERKVAGVEVKRKPQQVEQHFDDCGEDFTPLLYQQPNSDSDSNTEDIDEQPDKMMSQYFGMAGSEYYYDELASIGALHHQVQDATNAQDFTRSWVHSAQTYTADARPYDDIAELCGGEGATVKLLVRRGYRAGPNFDLVCGYDLMTVADRWYFVEYLNHCQPLVLIIGTPCTGLMGFSALNRVINPVGWQRSRDTSLRLGND
jgi:hypothetical protein